MQAASGMQLRPHSVPAQQASHTARHLRRRPAIVVAAAASSGPSTSQQVSSKYTVSLFDALKFAGPGPETINGRLAMVGFLNGAIHEFTSDETFLDQCQTQLGFPTLALLAMWVAASLIPICKGVRNNEAFWIFSPEAEMTNGRAAMLGIVVLTFLEYKAGVPFF